VIPDFSCDPQILSIYYLYYQYQPKWTKMKHNERWWAKITHRNDPKFKCSVLHEFETACKILMLPQSRKILEIKKILEYMEFPLKSLKLMEFLWEIKENCFYRSYDQLIITSTSSTPKVAFLLKLLLTISVVSYNPAWLLNIV
jgi:hypothetical protein